MPGLLRLVGSQSPNVWCNGMTEVAVHSQQVLCGAACQHNPQTDRHTDGHYTSHSPFTKPPPSSPPPPTPTCLPCRCEYGDLAGRLGLLPAGGRLTAVDTTGQIKLEGATSIVGRSIVIHEPGGPNFECGTIRLREELEGNVWH